MIVHNQSTHVCHIPRLRLRLMQHNSLIIWLVTVTGAYMLGRTLECSHFDMSTIRPIKIHPIPKLINFDCNAKTSQWIFCFTMSHLFLIFGTWLQTAQSPKSQPVYSGQGPIILWGHGALTLKGTMIRLPSGTGWSDPENQRDQPAYQICQESVAFLKWPFYACFCFTRSLCFVFLCFFWLEKKLKAQLCPFC